MAVLQNGKDDISLAQWALIEEFRAGKWKTLDLPSIARNDFDLNGIELVNTLLEVPTEGYLKDLKSRAADHGVAIVLIMIDDEGDGCAATKEGRKQFEIFHRKWVDIAHYLGCSAIRTNCRGGEGTSSEEALNWASESYHQLLAYAAPTGINILIENHGGFSDDADWMVNLMQRVAHPHFGTYPDWREPGLSYDNVEYLKKVVPYAKGLSYRNQPTEALTAQMIQLSKESGYHGWYGIESNGREEVKRGIQLLKKYLDTWV